MDKPSVSELFDRISQLSARADTVLDRLNKADQTFSPPDGVQSAAARGLKLREKWKRGGLSNAEASEQGIGSGVQRAVNLKNGDAISLQTVKRMHAFFSRHAKNYRPDEKESDGGPTAGTIAWLLWGGNAGRDWAQGIVNRVEKASPDAGDVHVPSPEMKKPGRKTGYALATSRKRDGGKNMKDC